MVPVSVGSSPRIAWNSVDLPAPLRPARTDARARHDLRGAVIDQKSSGNPDRYIGD